MSALRPLDSTYRFELVRAVALAGLAGLAVSVCGCGGRGLPSDWTLSRTPGSFPEGRAATGQIALEPIYFAKSLREESSPSERETRRERQAQVSRSGGPSSWPAASGQEQRADEVAEPYPILQSYIDALDNRFAFPEELRALDFDSPLPPSESSGSQRGSPLLGERPGIVIGDWKISIGFENPSLDGANRVSPDHRLR